MRDRGESPNRRAVDGVSLIIAREYQLPAFIGKILTTMPMFRGKGRLVNVVGRIASRFAPSTYAYPGFGARLHVDLRDRIQRHIRRDVRLCLTSARSCH